MEDINSADVGRSQKAAIYLWGTLVDSRSCCPHKGENDHGSSEASYLIAAVCRSDVLLFDDLKITVTN